MAEKIFLSYALQDRAFVRTALKALQHKGLIATSEMQVQPAQAATPKGASMRQELKRQIGEAGKVVVFWTEAGARSQWVNYETGMADALGKPMIVVADPNGPAVPANLSGAKVVNLARSEDASSDSFSTGTNAYSAAKKHR
jgi:hypothetical protein